MCKSYDTEVYVTFHRCLVYDLYYGIDNNQFEQI